MSKNHISTSENTIFESIKHVDENGLEYWYARELMEVLEYTKWSNFNRVIKSAIDSLGKSYSQTADHFAEVSKKIKIGKGTKKQSVRKIKDYKLTRRACYLIAQNGDSRKEAIALAQNYFATQTRKQEIQEAKEKDIERILARRKLSESEKKFAGVMNQRGIPGRGIAEIKSAGDEALFGKRTSEVKKELGVNQSKPLADHLPTISIKAKDLATEMTTYQTNEKDLQGKDEIKNEHTINNSAVRKMLTESGIYPEKLPAEEDVKKLERKYTEDEIHDVDDHKILSMDVLEIDIIGLTDQDELEKIRNIIRSQKGDSTLKVYYGNKDNPKLLERSIEINQEVINSLRKYLVITDGSFE